MVLRPWFRKSMSILSSRISLTCPIPNVACSIQFVGFHFIKDDFRPLYSEPKLTGLFHEARDHQVFEKLSLRASRNSVAQPFAAPPERKPERPRGRATSVPHMCPTITLMYNCAPAFCLFKIAHFSITVVGLFYGLADST
jgi:hypothetical protein